MCVCLILIITRTKELIKFHDIVILPSTLFPFLGVLTIPCTHSQINIYTNSMDFHINEYFKDIHVIACVIL